MRWGISVRMRAHTHAHTHALTDEQEPRVLGKGSNGLAHAQTHVGHGYEGLPSEPVRETAGAVDEEEGDGLVLGMRVVRG